MTYETWNLSDSFWRIPIQVEWQDNMAGCRLYKVGMKRLQELAEKFLSEIGVQKDGAWWMERQVLERLAEPNRHEDLEMAVRWNPPEKIVYTKEGTTETINEFVADVCTGLQINPDVVALLYSRICRTAMDWLLNKQRVVDLFFCRLHPMPLRENWQQQAVARASERTRINGGTNDPVNEINHEFLAYNHKHKILTWCVSVEHRRPWYEMGLRLELEKRKLTAAVYVQQSEKAIERCKASAGQILHSFMWQTALPPVFMCNGSGEGHRRFVAGLDLHHQRRNNFFNERPGFPKEFDTRCWKIIPNGKEYRLVRRGPKVAYTKRNSDWWNKSQCEWHDHFAKKPKVPQVPPVRSEVADVRPVGSDLRGSGGGGETTGLPVLDPNEEPVGSELLAGRTDRGSEGLATRVEQSS